MPTLLKRLKTRYVKYKRDGNDVVNHKRRFLFLPVYLRRPPALQCSFIDKLAYDGRYHIGFARRRRRRCCGGDGVA